MVDRLMENLPSEYSVDVCQNAIRKSNGDLNDAFAYLKSRKLSDIDPDPLGVSDYLVD